jgi:hypothetical protein
VRFEERFEDPEDLEDLDEIAEAERRAYEQWQALSARRRELKGEPKGDEAKGPGKAAKGGKKGHGPGPYGRGASGPQDPHEVFMMNAGVPVSFGPLGQSSNSMDTKDDAKRKQLDNQISDSTKKLEALNAKLLPLRTKEAITTSDIGPLKYIAEMIYGEASTVQFDKAVRFVIIFIVNKFLNVFKFSVRSDYYFWTNFTHVIFDNNYLKLNIYYRWNTYKIYLY